MGEIYQGLNKTDDTINLLWDTVQKSPENYAAYTELAWYYIENNQTTEAEDIFNKYKTDRYELLTVYGKIEERYKEKGQFVKADEISKKIYEIRQSDFKITQKNYLQLYKTLHKKGIKLMIMQYPTLKIDELKNIFRGDEDIIFISNEENFKKVLENSYYDDYFIDKFGKTFGHATKKGNILIAENVANEILNLVNE